MGVFYSMLITVGEARHCVITQRRILEGRSCQGDTFSCLLISIQRIALDFHLPFSPFLILIKAVDSKELGLVL